MAPSREAMERANQLGTKPRAINMQGRALLEGSYGGLQKKNETKRKRNDGENEGADEGGTEANGVLSWGWVGLELSWSCMELKLGCNGLSWGWVGVVEGELEWVELELSWR